MSNSGGFYVSVVNTAPANSIRFLTARLPQLHAPQTAPWGQLTGSYEDAKSRLKKSTPQQHEGHEMTS